jgi:hypothetical protein
MLMSSTWAVENAMMMSPEGSSPRPPDEADAQGGAAGQSVELMRQQRRIGADHDDD